MISPDEKELFFGKNPKNNQKNLEFFQLSYKIAGNA
jgi:hypothetical protein